jgi:TonB-dependent Receptor Plug Domain/TonB dependent receptor
MNLIAGSLLACGATILSLVVPCMAVAADGWVGRHLADVLRDAGSLGVRVIFSDRLVPEALRVNRAPVSTDIVEALREVLRPHGLALDDVTPGVYVVTRERSEQSTPVHAPTSELLAQAEVTASRYTFEAMPLEAPFMLESAALDAQSALFNDATQSIRRFPGTAGHTLSSQTFVRGGSADENLILLDGVPLHEPFHLQGFPVNFSVIDPSVLGRVDLFSGVLPVEYDGRMSSMVDMRLREPADRVAGRFALGTLDTSASMSGPLPNEQGDWMLFGRRGVIERASQFIIPSIGKPTVNDFLGRVRYRLTDRSEWIAGALTAHDHFHVSRYGGDELANDESERSYVWTAYEKRWEKLSSRTLLAHTLIRSEKSGELHDYLDTEWSGTLGDERTYRSLLLREDWTLQLAGGGTLRWGASATDEHADINYFRIVDFPEGVASLLGRATHEAFSTATATELREYDTYIGINRELSGRVTLDGGVHWSHAAYSTGQSSSAWEPRLGLLFDISTATRLRFSAGRMTQRSPAIALPVEQSRLLFDAPSTNTMQVLALEHDFAHDISARAEIFEKRIHHPAPRLENAFSPDAFLPELRPDAIIVAPAFSRARGFDLYATAKLFEYWSGWLSYSYSQVTDEIEGEEVARAWDQPHALSMGVSFNGGGWLISLVASGHSSWPLTPLHNDPESDSALVTDPSIKQTVGVRSSIRGGYYYTLDLKTARDFQLRTGSLQLSFDIANVTDRKNACCDDVEFADLGGPVPGAIIVKWPDRKYWQPFYPYASIVWQF